jgi:hypothetical protein
MLLQEHKYLLCYDGQIDEGKSHQFIEQGASSSSVTSTCANMSPPNSFRKTFDLSSVNSLPTSSSSSNSYCLSSPPRKTSTLRYRGQSSSSLSSPSKPSVTESAATRALLEVTAHKDTRSSLQEVREEPGEIKQSLDETQGERDLCTRETATATATSDTSRITSMHPVVILLGYIVVPFLQLTISIERYLRSIFASLFAPSSSFQQETINSDGEELYSSSIVNLRQGLLDGNAIYSGPSEAVCCYSSSSSSSSSDDDNTESEQDGWGHFADFQDELADEASFIPSCSVRALRSQAVSAVAGPPSCATTLETLAEVREEDDDAGEDWIF